MRLRGLPSDFGLAYKRLIRSVQEMIFTSEFRLAAACCIWPPSEHRRNTIKAALTSPLDWDKFLRVVKRQNVSGLVAHGLREVGAKIPPAVDSQIGNAAKKIARSNLAIIAECRKIQTAFDAATLPIVFVKGATLGALAYGNIGIKHSWDIDILVHDHDVPQAVVLLEELGYRPGWPLPARDSAAYRFWLKYGQEWVLSNRSTNVHVELHWRLVGNATVLTNLSPSSQTRWVAVSEDVRLRTLAEDDLLLYLCVHGARHNWSRLKWLADVGALFAKMDAEAWRRILAYARRSHVEICLTQAIMLCSRLFGMPQPTAVVGEPQTRWRHRLPERLALRYLVAGGGEIDVTLGYFGQLELFLSRYLLVRGLSYKWAELKLQLCSPVDLMFDDTIAASFLYPFLRVVRWLARAGRQREAPLGSRSDRSTHPAPPGSTAGTH